MNRMVKIAGITAALAATLLLGGCNEEKKYNALKMEVVPEIEAALNIENEYHGPLGNSEAVITGYETAIAKIEEKEQSIQKKLTEMEKLSKDDVNLSNDYLRVKKEAEKVTNSKNFYMERLEKTKFYKDYRFNRVLPFNDYIK